MSLDRTRALTALREIRQASGTSTLQWHIANAALTAAAEDEEPASFTLAQVQAVLGYGRLEGSPTMAAEVIEDLKRAGKWPT